MVNANGGGLWAQKIFSKHSRTRGFDPGEIDGIWGRHTIAAVKAFQAANDLTVDGIVGPHTMQALFGVAPAPDAVNYVWYNEALRLMGTKEVSGNGSNKAILDWATHLGIDYKSDDIPWCGLFVGHCIGETLPDEVLPSKSPGRTQLGHVRQGMRLAAHWMRAGLLARIQASGKGHVGFYYGEDDDGYYVLGGNQSDMVRVAKVPKARFLAARQPATVGTLPPKTVTRTLADAVEGKEA